MEEILPNDIEPKNILFRAHTCINNAIDKSVISHHSLMQINICSIMSNHATRKRVLHSHESYDLGFFRETISALLDVPRDIEWAQAPRHITSVIYLEVKGLGLHSYPKCCVQE